MRTVIHRVAINLQCYNCHTKTNAMHIRPYNSPSLSLLLNMLPFDNVRDELFVGWLFDYID